MTRVRIKDKGASWQSYRGLKARLEQLSVASAARITTRVTPIITGEAQASYDGGRTAYNDGRKLGVFGNALDLVETGDNRSDMRFLQTGTTRLTAFLGQPYSKYLVGKYRILPSGQQRMPAHWRAAIRRIAYEVVGQKARDLFRDF